jgi:hypothetical protein
LRCYAEREPRWTLDDRECAEREWALLRALEARGFPVPHAYGWGREGGGWVLMDRVPGRPAGASVAARRDALCWLNRLHSVAAESIRQAPLPHVTLAGTIARARAWAEEAGCVELQEAAACLTRRVAVPESPGQLLHGSAFPDRFRAARGRVVGWVCWAHGALGDPRWDLAGFAGEAVLGGEPDPVLAPFLGDVERLATLRLYAAALALREGCAAACRTARLAKERGAEHPSVLSRAPLVERSRRRCLAALAALEASYG